MKLGKKQELFARLECQITPKANALGYEVRKKECQRAPEQCEYNATHCGTCRELKTHINHPADHKFHKIGIKFSVHRDGLAQDIILSKHGKVQWGRSSYLALGQWWEKLHPLCRWGGRHRDPGHFSLTHGGRR
jgi:hypothetical protein